MCSACAGDDPRPEMFTTFDISSPKTPPVFAMRDGAERKVYGTQDAGRNVRKPALTLGVSRFEKIEWIRRWRAWPGWQGSVYSGFRWAARTEDGPSAAELSSGVLKRCVTNRFSPEQSESNRCSGAPIEIRVSPNAIVEVYGASGASEGTAECMADDRDGSEWAQSRAAREVLQRAFADYWRVRRAQCAAAYMVLVALAAIAVWFAIR